MAASGARAALLADQRAPGPFHVATLLDNVPEFVCWLGAAGLAGAVLVGGNPTHRGADLARDLAHTECQLLVTDAAHLPLVDGLDLGPGIGTVSASSPRVLVVTTTPPTAPPSTPTPAPRSPSRAPTTVTAESLGYLIFTSGTSGAPKACRCTQGRLARIGTIVAQMFELTADDVCYVAMPLFHSNALMAGLEPGPGRRGHGGAAHGRPLLGVGVPPRRPPPRRHLLQLRGQAACPTSSPPPSGPTTPTTRSCGCSATRAPRPTSSASANASAAWWSTATGPPKAAPRCNARPTHPAARSAGPPRAPMVVDPDTGAECPVARFDDNGRLANAEEAIGELVSKPAAEVASRGTGATTRPSGPVCATVGTGPATSPIATTQGFFYFAGRSDDWLRVDGENFAAAPVARILERHPDVVLAAVYAVPDPVVGDQVMAALQLRPGAEFDPEEFAAFLAAQSDMGTKWAPRFVRVCPALPVTATSKVLVRTLRAERWNSADPVWWRPRGGAEERFRPLGQADVAHLEESVARR